MVLKPWSQRDRSVFEIQKDLQNNFLGQIAGLNTFAFVMPSLPGAGGGLPVEFILNTTSDYSTLESVADELVGRAMQSGLLCS